VCDEYEMSKLSGSNFTESAHLILDKPLVAQRMEADIAAGQRYTDVLKRYITKPGVAYVVLVDGVVVDQNEIIQQGVEIRCVPQIIGG
jgi:hypothetical protein